MRNCAVCTPIKQGVSNMAGISILRLRLWPVAVVFMMMAGLGVSRLSAQTTRAGISGTVIDSSGAAVPGASIVARNVGTSDGQGRYVVPELPVGNYDVRASRQGFQTVDHPNITLTVGSEAVVDFTMPVGQAQQTVTVESQVTQVDTTSAAVSSTVE